MTVIEKQHESFEGSVLLEENINTIRAGNRCGHDKVHPRFFSAPKKHKNRPNILREAASQAGRFYQEHQKYLPNLRYANGSYQQQRSERREAAAGVLQVLLHYTDLATLQVGTPKSSVGLWINGR